MVYNKIFGIGCPKTGTSTLGRCFVILGFSHKGWDPKLWKKYQKGDFEAVFKVAERFDSFEDGPWNGPCLVHNYHSDSFYKRLDKRFPNSKFILTIRDTDDWIKSHEGWFSSKGLKLISKKYRIEEYDKKRATIISRYENRNKEIINYFKNKPEDLLVINICKGKGWNKLCSFLGLQVPKDPFPHENRTPY